MTVQGLRIGDEVPDGEVGEGILVSTAAVAAEHLEQATRAGGTGDLLAPEPRPSRSGAGGGPTTIRSDNADRSGPDVRGSSEP
jgi:hypothetical protein